MELPPPRKSIAEVKDLEGEIWRDIIDFEGLYQVSNLGRVKRLKGIRDRGKTGLYHYSERILNFAVVRGYQVATLSKNSKMKQIKIHRLVACAFIPNPENKATVNHISGNKLENNVENLEWNTILENIRHARRTGLSAIVRPWLGKINEDHHNSKPVIQFTLNGVYVETFPSLNEVQRKFGFSASGIGRCARGKGKASYGYKWKFKLIENE